MKSPTESCDRKVTLTIAEVRVAPQIGGEMRKTHESRSISTNILVRTLLLEHSRFNQPNDTNRDRYYSKSV